MVRTALVTWMIEFATGTGVGLETTLFATHTLASWVQISWRHVDKYETNTRDHDFGNEVKNGKSSNFPYMFPDQLV